MHLLPSWRMWVVVAISSAAFVVALVLTIMSLQQHFSREVEPLRLLVAQDTAAVAATGDPPIFTLRNLTPDQTPLMNLSRTKLASINAGPSVDVLATGAPGIETWSLHIASIEQFSSGGDLTGLVTATGTGSFAALTSSAYNVARYESIATVSLSTQLSAADPGTETYFEVVIDLTTVIPWIGLDQSGVAVFCNASQFGTRVTTMPTISSFGSFDTSTNLLTLRVELGGSALTPNLHIVTFMSFLAATLNV